MSRKADIFKEEDFKLLDEHATSVPLHLIISGSLQDVVSYLTSHSDCNSELATVRAIFKWVTSAQVFKIQNYSGLESSNLAREIKTASLAELMKNTCSLAGISCEVVKGFKKCSAYEIDEHLNTNAVSDWNVVNIDKSWRLMDPNFASRKVVNKESGKWKEIERDGTAMNRDIAASEGITVHEYDEFFFLTDPDHLTWTHFPLESTWQLLKQPVTQNEFENHFYARRGLFDLNMTYDASTQSNYIMKTKEGEVEFRFRLPPERSSKYSFTYHLYIAKANSLTRNIEAALDKLVFYELNESCVTFSVRCPVKGYFQLKVFGHDEETMSNVMYLCCTYLIHCTQPKRNCLPLPDRPPNGWGPTEQTKKVGLEPVTHKHAKIEAKDGHVEIRLAKEYVLAFHQLLKHAFIDEATLSQFSTMELLDDEAVIYLRLPHEGEYALKLFAQSLQGKGEGVNVLNYLIQNFKPSAEIQPFPLVANGILGRNHLNSSLFGVTPFSHPGGILDATTDGKVSVDITANDDVELVYEIRGSDKAASRKATILAKQDGKKRTFELDTPVKGEYSLNVYARKKQEKQMHIVHSYLIRSSGLTEDREDGEEKGKSNKKEEKGKAKAQNKNKKQGKEVQQPNGKELECAQKTEETEDGSQGELDGEDNIHVETLETSETQLVLPLPVACTDPLAEVHRTNGQDEPDKHGIEFYKSKGTTMMKASFATLGEYMLSIFQKTMDAARVKTIARYQINRVAQEDLCKYDINKYMEEMEANRDSDDDTSDGYNRMSQEERKQAAAKELQKAIDLQFQLKGAIMKYKETGVDEEDPLLVRAQKELDILQAKSELKEAVKSRNPDLIKTAIGHARKVNSNNKLDAQIAVASQVGSSLGMTENKKTVTTSRAEASIPDQRTKDELADEKSHRSLRLALQQAVESKSRPKLKAAMTKYRDAGCDVNDPLFLSAQKELDILTALTELRAAMQKRDLTNLRAAIKKAKTVNYNSRLNKDIAKAKAFEERLLKLYNLRHDVLKLEPNTLMELRSYSTPPTGVYPCMKATFVLLGYLRPRTDSWKKIQGNLAHPSEMKKKISELDPRRVTKAQEAKVRQLLEPYTKDMIHNVSAGAATFYVLVKGVIDELDAYRKDDEEKGLKENEDQASA